MSVAKSVASSVARAVAASVGVSGDGSGPAGYDVWLVIGQSNASGTNGEFTAGIDDEVHPRAKQWPFAGPGVGTLIDAVDEMWHQDWEISPRTGFNVGYGAKFARLYAATTPDNRTTVVVPAAWGGTVSNNWLPDVGQSVPAGGLLLPPAIEKLDEVLALPGVNSFKGVLWLQGEGDQNGSPVTYRANIDTIIAYFRNNYPGSLFLIGQMVPGFMRSELRERNGTVGASKRVTGLPTGHGFASADIVSAYWDGGMMTNITAYDIATNQIALDDTLGVGTPLPDAGTPITLRENVTANINLINDEHIAAPGRSANVRSAFWWGTDVNNLAIHYGAAEQRANAQIILDTLSTAQANVLGVAPSAPTNLTALVIGAKSVKIGWKHPVSRVTKFQVKWRASGGSWTTIDTGSRAIDYYFRTLSPLTTYEFSVFATNETGNSPDSSILTVVVDVPGAPTSLAAGTPTTSAVPLTWTAPSSGGIISDYTVQYRLSGSGTWLTYSDAVSANASATVTGLTQDSDYEFQVAAKNVSGTGTYSSVATARTLAATVNKWDSVTASPQLVFDESDRRIIGNNTGSVGFKIAKSTLSFAGGKRYGEITISSSTAGLYQVGLAKVASWSNTETALGFQADSVGAYNGTNSTLASGFTVVNDTTGFYSGLTVGSVIQIAFDYSAGKAWIGKNGTWFASGDPATGVNPWVTWTPSGAVALAVMDYQTQGSGNSPGLRLAATQTYLPPSGFTEING